MRSRGLVPVLAIAVAPWSALGALVHGFVLTVAVVPLLALALRPRPGESVLLFVAVQSVVSATAYWLLAPGGLESSRAKFMTVVSVGCVLLAVFCAGIGAYALQGVESGGGRATALVLGLLGVLVYLVAVGASVEAVLAGTGSE